MAREIRTITDFKAKLLGGAARPNLFEVSIPTFPSFVTGWDDDTFSFLCKAAALPASNIAQIDVPFRGRILKVLETEPSILGLQPSLMMRTSN